MSRKKISEMNTQELADLYLKKASWEKAEEVCIEILARCLARRPYVLKDLYDFETFLSTFAKICKRSNEWAKENSFALAAASAMNDHSDKDKSTDERCCGCCQHFQYEDIDGYGYCDKDKVKPEAHCSDVCKAFKHR